MKYFSTKQQGVLMKTCRKHEFQRHCQYLQDLREQGKGTWTSWEPPWWNPSCPCSLTKVHRYGTYPHRNSSRWGAISPHCCQRASWQEMWSFLPQITNYSIYSLHIHTHCFEKCTYACTGAASWTDEKIWAGNWREKTMENKYWRNAEGST